MTQTTEITDEMREEWLGETCRIVGALWYGKGSGAFDVGDYLEFLDMTVHMTDERDQDIAAYFSNTRQEWYEEVETLKHQTGEIKLLLAAINELIDGQLKDNE